MAPGVWLCELCTPGDGASPSGSPESGSRPPRPATRRGSRRMRVISVGALLVEDRPALVAIAITAYLFASVIRRSREAKLHLTTTALR
jgi:hypothetical protein